MGLFVQLDLELKLGLGLENQMLFTNYGNAIQQGYLPLWILHIVGIVYNNVKFFLVYPFFAHIENELSGFFMDNRYGLSCFYVAFFMFIF